MSDLTVDSAYPARRPASRTDVPGTANSSTNLSRRARARDNGLDTFSEPWAEVSMGSELADPSLGWLPVSVGRPVRWSAASSGNSFAFLLLIKIGLLRYKFFRRHRIQSSANLADFA